jgi:hypothetical protein
MANDSDAKFRIWSIFRVSNWSGAEKGKTMKGRNGLKKNPYKKPMSNPCDVDLG